MAYPKSNLPLRVLHFPQVPCEPFIVEVQDEAQAALLVYVLAIQHLWLERGNFITDYSNAILVEQKRPVDATDLYSIENDGWESYFNDEAEMEWDEFEEAYFEKGQLKEQSTEVH